MGRLETAPALLRYDELVAPDAPSVAAYADVGGVAQAVAPVLAVSGVDQYVLYVEPSQKIISSFYLPLRISSASRFISASKARIATSLGVSTPGLK